MDRVESALKSAGAKTILVFYETDTFTPIYSDRSYHGVWEISVGGRPVRTFCETSQAYEQDNGLAPWLGGAFVISGVFLGYQAYRKRGA